MNIKDYSEEDGTHEELVNRENGIYAEMFATQARYYIMKGLPGEGNLA